jgi:prepilin signal peptidase PulO-like enzyme (type II secretory pathway)
MQTYVIAVLMLFIGWASGALLNYLADILPAGVRSPGPICTKCGKPMTWVNYFIWPRKCAVCQTSRSWRTWIVEILAVVGVVWLWMTPPDKIGFFVGLALLFYFGLIVIIDIEHRLILQWVCLAGGIFGVVIGTWINGFFEAIIGGVIGFATMLVLYYAGKLILKLITRKRTGVSQRKDEALGLGDVILAGIIGLMLGYKVILTALVIAVFIGSIYSLVYLVILVATRRYRMLSMIPYGPFLIASTVFLLYFPKIAAVLSAR